MELPRKSSLDLEEELAKFALSHALIQARTNKGLTQQELAKELGVTQAYIAKLEGGKANPTVGNAARIFAAMGCRLLPSTAISGVAELALGFTQRNFGSIHPKTLAIRNQLALAYVREQRFENAQNLCEAALSDILEVVAANHPAALLARNNLAAIYLSTGRHEDAIRLSCEALELTVNKLGTNHPDALSLRHNLAIGYRMVGAPDQALKLDQDNFETRKLVLGSDHHSTLDSLLSLAGDYLAIGDWENAIRMHEEFMAITNGSLDPEDPPIPLSGGFFDYSPEMRA